MNSVEDLIECVCVTLRALRKGTFPGAAINNCDTVMVLAGLMTQTGNLSAGMSTGLTAEGELLADHIETQLGNESFRQFARSASQDTLPARIREYVTSLAK